MKSALLPAVRVEPQVRDDAESVLTAGENLSAFIEQAVMAHVSRRKTQQAFVQRGLASLEAAKSSGTYYTPDFVLGELEEILGKAEAPKAKPR